MYSIEEFNNYYIKYKKTPNMMSVPKHTFNSKELMSKYKAYVRQLEKKLKDRKENTDIEWLNVVDIVTKRDYNSCRLMKILNKEELNYMRTKYPSSILETLDCAHVIPRSKSKNLYYNPDNIVKMNRVSHGFLDTYKDPIYGLPISLEKRNEWWEKIVGKETYQYLVSNI